MEMGSQDPNSKMADYEVMEQIGRSSFAATFLVLHRTENKKYVLKKFNLSKQSEKFKRTALQEMNSISKLSHPYILELKDSWVDGESCICIVANHCERGDISQVVRRSRGAHFPEEVVCKWLVQILQAIDYLHSNRVHHRNLKLSNILVTKENDIRLGDFGLFNEGCLSCSDSETRNYVFPELLAGAPYSYKSDIWSLGCCVFEIAAHQQAFRASDMAGLVNKINRSLISPLPIVYSPPLKQIIKSMLRKSPEHRPTAAELLRHPHLQPFLLNCHDPSPTFLPVKSPSPRTAQEKKVRTTPSSSGSKKESRGRGRGLDMKLKQKELLPLFDENKGAELPSLLDSDISTEDMLETKRVDPTSYFGKISTDSEDSKSADTVYGTPAGNNACLSSEKERTTMIEPESSSSFEDAAVSARVQETAKSEDGVAEGGECIQRRLKPAPQRADALESLLELCAVLQKPHERQEDGQGDGVLAKILHTLCKTGLVSLILQCDSCHETRAAILRAIRKGNSDWRLTTANELLPAVFSRR